MRNEMTVRGAET